MKENLPAFFMPIVLIAAGTISPSNGIDEGYNKGAFDLLTTAFAIMFVAIIFYVLGRNVNFFGRTNEKS